MRVGDVGVHGLSGPRPRGYAVVCRVRGCRAASTACRVRSWISASRPRSCGRCRTGLPAALLGGQAAGDGSCLRSCGSTRRRAVQNGRVVVAAAAGLAAGVGAHDQGAGQGGPGGGGELGRDLVQGRAAAGSMRHTVSDPGFLRLSAVFYCGQSSRGPGARMARHRAARWALPPRVEAARRAPPASGCGVRQRRGGGLGAGDPGPGQAPSMGVLQAGRWAIRAGDGVRPEVPCTVGDRKRLTVPPRA